eukprot:COSAG05_NODE_327_length_11345_cov_16.236884_2_plen_60_part_00
MSFPVGKDCDQCDRELCDWLRGGGNPSTTRNAASDFRGVTTNIVQVLELVFESTTINDP